MASVFREGALAILDSGAAGESHPDPDALYVVTNGPDAAVRWVRFAPAALYTIHAAVRDRPLEWKRLTGSQARAAIRARLHLLPPLLRHSPDVNAPRRPPGTVLKPQRRSFAS